MATRSISTSLLVFACMSAAVALYLVTDYYMDDGWVKSFGMVCGSSVQDDCAFVNSHLNTFGIINYDDNIKCVMMLDAGKQHGAKYKLKFKRFHLEAAPSCSADYLEMYDAVMSNMTQATLFGRFCGNMEPNLTSFPTQQYVTLRFKTDGSKSDKGFRILATRTLPYPCHDDYFHCKAENRCIDGRLKCDGIPQCDDETDEDGCSFWDKLVGGLLALGVAGLIGIVGMCVFVCTGVGVIICICTCCRKRCDCLFKGCGKCWGKICSPVKKKIGQLKKSKVGSASNGGIKDGSMANNGETLSREQTVALEDKDVGMVHEYADGHLVNTSTGPAVRVTTTSTLGDSVNGGESGVTKIETS